MKHILLILFTTLIFLSLVSCKLRPSSQDLAKNDTPIVLRLAELHIETYPTTQACEYFSRLVSERTEGRVQVDIYSQGKLGTEVEVINSIQNGDIDIGRVNCIPLTEYSKNLTPIIMPYLFKDASHLQAVLCSDIGDNILNTMENGFVGLAWYDSGSRCFYFTKEVHSVSDLDNIRIQDNQMMYSMIQALGANPVIMNWDDIYEGLDVGTLDGAENDITSYENFVHNAVAPYFINDNHTFSPSLLLSSETALNKLSAEDQAILRECAKDSQEYEFDLWEKATQESIEAVKEGNTVFIDLTAEELQEFQNACEPLYTTYAEEYLDVIEQIKNFEY